MASSDDHGEHGEHGSSRRRPDHPDSVDSWDTPAGVLRGQGRHDEADPVG
ncbi:hypothetical protein [Streptomyces sp. NPDC058371]